MKTSGNEPIVEVQRWKEGEWSVAINHKDNGVQPEGDEGKRYEADFTVVKGNTAEEAIYAFTRMQQDPVFDKLVIDNIEVEGKPAIEVKREYAVKVEPTIFKPLPASGTLKKGEVYSYANGAVMVVKKHDRTIYTPEETPDLFSFWRPNSDNLDWVKNEKIEVGWKRKYDGKLFQCIKSHSSYDGYFPTLTIGVLWVEIPQQGEKPPQWDTANWVSYIVGYEVFDSGKVWKAKNTTHTWIQPSLEGNGAISWEFVKDWVE